MPRANSKSRLAEISAGVREVLASLAPQAMAVEELYSHYERPRTAILMGHARGVICLAAAEAGIPVCHYAATQVKRLLTGSGRANKLQIQQAVCREFSLAEPPEPPDVADALAIALCHYYLHRNKVALVITRIKGKLEHVDEETATVIAGPFDYEVLIPDCVRRQLQHCLGADVSLHTVHYLEGNAGPRPTDAATGRVPLRSGTRVLRNVLLRGWRRSARKPCAPWSARCAKWRP